MSRKYLFILLLVHSVLSDECVRYVFEDYDDLFTIEVPACSGQASWSQGIYQDDESPIAAPNEKSEWFITPSNFDTVACTGSFSFTMMPGALVEVMIYVERGTDLSFTIVLLQITNTNHHTVGLVTLDDNEVDGWHVVSLRNTLSGAEPFQGYIAFLGRASEDSVIIVDSFRYVPLTMDPEEDCILYEDIPEPIITTEPTTTPTTTPTTIEPTTMGTTIADSSTEGSTASTPTDADSCWTPLAIIITVLVSIIVLVIVAALSFYVGILTARKKIKVEDDVDYNVPQILPRVKRMYPEINSNKYNTQP